MVQYDKVFATETVDKGSIPGRIKPKTLKIDIHSCLAWRSASTRDSVKPPSCVMDRWQLDLKTEKVFSPSPGKGNIANQDAITISNGWPNRKKNFQNRDFIYAKIKKSRPDLLTRPNRYLFKDMELCHIANQ